MVAGAAGGRLDSEDEGLVDEVEVQNQLELPSKRIMNKTSTKKFKKKSKMEAVTPAKQNLVARRLDLSAPAHTKSKSVSPMKHLMEKKISE